MAARVENGAWKPDQAAQGRTQLQQALQAAQRELVACFGELLGRAVQEGGEQVAARKQEVIL